jgi:hypothetical protein
MKIQRYVVPWIVVLYLATVAVAQEPICIDGNCKPETLVTGTIYLNPLREELQLEEEPLFPLAATSEQDRFDQVIRATVRVTVSGVCGSGTVVGRTQEGNAIVLTNAHVAGTTRGRTVNVERWNTDGSSERSTGTIISSGYGRGTSVDFALLKCNANFARDVAPIPLADRYPSRGSSVTTFGCPRCEWPSLQVLRLNRREGQILSWKPEAIGGRSGSSLIDYSEGGPRVVGLLTWAGGGEGLGQSTPFLLSAMRGKLPATLEGLPEGVREVNVQTSDEDQRVQVPSTTQGEPLQWPMGLLAQSQVQDEFIDSIVDRPDLKPSPREPEDRQPIPNPPEGLTWTAGQLIATSAVSSILLILGLQYGLPLLLQAIRQMRKSRGQTLLTEDQFQQLLNQYQQLIKLLEQNTKSSSNGSDSVDRVR